jgi:uncharacterized protein YprB with RNaseH-like and TPR domain
MDDFSALLKKLDGLGVKVGTSQLPEHQVEIKPAAIEDLIQGEYESTQFGDIFISTTRYPFPYDHGVQPLVPPKSFMNISRWAKYREADEYKINTTLFLDTETSGLAGGTGTFAFMIGLGWFDRSDFVVRQLFMRDPSEEQALLAVLSRVTNNYSCVVTYNGKSFDIPLLRSRHIQNHFPFEMGEWNHIDLLHLVRQVWKYSQESRTLKDMEVNILRYQRSQEEVPGWLVPQLYFEYLQTRDPQPLVGVFYHNAIDIVSLAALFCATSQMLDSPFEPLSIPSTSADYIGLARIFEKISLAETAARLYATGIENGLPDELEMPTLLRYAELCKRNGYFDDAIHLWTRAASQGNIDACVELAKYYEHQACDLQMAYTCTVNAISYLPEKHTYSSRKQESNLNNRLNRLLKKIDHIIEPGEPENVTR